MKRILLLSVLLLTIYSFSFAGRNQTRLSVSVLTSYPVSIFINGVAYNPDNSGHADLMLNHLRPGYHTIQVIRRGRSAFSHPSYQGSVLFRGRIFLKNGFHMDMVINRFGNSFQDELPINRPEYSGYGSGGQLGGSHLSCMENGLFGNMKNTLRNIAFEDTRLSTCKQMVSSNTLSSMQVKELMQLFSFEDNKLEIAKFAYDYTADPENYFNTYDAFGFNSSRDEMNRFIRDQQ